MGFALLAMAIGGLTIMPFTSFLMNKIGNGRTNILFTTMMFLCSIIPVVATSYWILIIGMFLTGMFLGAQDVAMNAAADAIEKELNIKIMSTCHGFFSLGLMLGAFTASFAIGQEIGKELHMVITVVLMLAFLFLSLSRRMLQFPSVETEEDTLFVLPKGPLLMMGLVGFCVMMAEGAVNDWSAIYLKDTLMANSYAIGFGLAGFSFSMAIGRFYGDIIVPKYGAKRIVSLGSLIGAIGILVAVVSSSMVLAVIGFTIVGIGFSCVVPVLFRNAASVPTIASGVGVAAVSTSGFLGFLIGPPTIGFIGETYGLDYGLGFAAILSLLAFLMALRVAWYE